MTELFEKNLLEKEETVESEEKLSINVSNQNETISQDEPNISENHECKCPWCYLENGGGNQLKVMNSEEKVKEQVEEHVEEQVEEQVEERVEEKVGQEIATQVDNNTNIHNSNEMSIQTHQLSPEIVFMQTSNLKSDRKFFHNKFQLQIEDQNKLITNLKNQNSDKDGELELFKNNIRTIQLQLQEKTQIINNLSESLLKERNTIVKLQNDILENKNKFNLEKENFENVNTILCNNNNQLIKDKEEMSANLENITNKYDNLNEVYKNTLNNFNEKTNNYHKLELSLKQSNDQANLHKENMILMQNEINTLKETLLVNIKEVERLKDQLASQIILQPVPEDTNEEIVINSIEPVIQKPIVKKKGSLPSKRK